MSRPHRRHGLAGLAGLLTLAWLPAAPQEWTRRRLQILLAASVVVGLGLVAGAVVSVTALLRDDHAPEPSAARGFQGPIHVSSQDALAQAPLPQAGGLEDAQPGTLSTETTSRITLPTATRMGAAGVPTGFPHTPEGALAQLIAIDRTAIEPAQVARAQEVIAAWALPGGPTPHSWSGVEGVATLLSAAGYPASGAPEMQIRLEPAMGFIKGTVGEDFVVPCVDYVISSVITSAVVNSSAGGEVDRIAAADCQRMVWRRDRWVIGAGDEPAPAPSVWPGTQASIDAGYRWLEVPQ